MKQQWTEKAPVWLAGARRVLLLLALSAAAGEVGAKRS